MFTNFISTGIKIKTYWTKSTLETSEFLKNLMFINVRILVFGDFNDQVHKLLNCPKQGKGGHF